MSVRTGKILSYILAAILIAFIITSVITDMPVYVPLVAVVIAMLLLRLIRRYTREITVDERLRTVNEKAAAISYRVFSFLMAVLGIAFISAQQALPDVFVTIGETMVYSAGTFMLIHLVFYYYYARKY